MLWTVEHKLGKPAASVSRLHTASGGAAIVALTQYRREKFDSAFSLLARHFARTRLFFALCSSSTLPSASSSGGTYMASRPRYPFF